MMFVLGVHEFCSSCEIVILPSNDCARNGIVGSARQVVCVGRKENEVGVSKRRSTLILAKIRKERKTAETEYPWSEKFAAGSEAEESLKFLSRFKPLPKPVTLPFESPLVDLENKIDEVVALNSNYRSICLSVHSIAQ